MPTWNETLPLPSLYHLTCVAKPGAGKTSATLYLIEKLVQAGIPVLALDTQGGLATLAQPPHLARVYTPGSDAATPVALSGLLQKPQEPELIPERATSLGSALLTLTGDEGNTRSPAQVVLSHVIETGWKTQAHLSLEWILEKLLDPPFAKVGVFETDRFFPPDDRLILVRKLNTVVFGPDFSAWEQGIKLDLGEILTRPQASIFLLSHLEPGEQQFFARLVLDHLVEWAHAQTHPTQQAMLILDELDLPLSSDARSALLAASIGIFRTTSRPPPEEPNYLWGPGFALPAPWTAPPLTEPRQFYLLQAGNPAISWTCPPLPGGTPTPLTRAQLRALKNPSPRKVIPLQQTAQKPPQSQWLLDPRMVFSARLEGAFTPDPANNPELQPAFLIEVRLKFREASVGFSEERREFRVFYPLEDELPLAPLILALTADDLLPIKNQEPCAPLPGWLDEEQEVQALSQRVLEQLLQSESSGVWVNPVLKLNSRAGEREDEFLTRCERALQERCDLTVAGLHQDVQREVGRLETRNRELTRQKERLELEKTGCQNAELVNAGETLLAWFTGRSRSLSAAVGHRQRVGELNQRISEVDQELSAVMREMYELEAGVVAQVEAIRLREREVLKETVHREVLLATEDARVVRAGVLWLPLGRRAVG